MPQFLPNIKDVFGEIKKHKRELEERINLETIDCKDRDSDKINDFEPTTKNYILKETYKQ
jgi:hypothetical protein